MKHQPQLFDDQAGGFALYSEQRPDHHRATQKRFDAMDSDTRTKQEALFNDRKALLDRKPLE